MLKQIFKSVNRLNKNKSAGFTLIELLVVISIIGFLTVSTVVVFNIVRKNARDAVRAGNVATITRALAMYLNDSATGYPASAGECLNAAAGAGLILKNSKVLLTVPADPLSSWSASAPNPVPNTAAPYTTDSDGFCYYYVSTANSQFQVYYYLESTSKSGSIGPNLRTQ